MKSFTLSRKKRQKKAGGRKAPFSKGATLRGQGAKEKPPMRASGAWFP